MKTKTAALKQMDVWLEGIPLMWGLLGRNFGLVLGIWPDSCNGSFYKKRWVLDMPSRRQQHLQGGRESSKEICNTESTSTAQEDWQAVMLLRVTNTVCINPLAIITSHVIDIALLCSSLKALFDWIFWKTLPYQYSAGKASFSSSCSREWTLALCSPLPLSALPCSAAGLSDSCSAMCSCPQGVRFWGSPCHTSELYRVTGKPNIGKQHSQFGL